MTATPEEFADADERLFALMAMAEDQQTAVRAGIDGLTLERAALAKERVALVQQAEQLKKATEKLANVVEKTLPALVEACALGTRKAIEHRLAEVAETAARAAAETAAKDASAAAQPMLDEFKASVSSAAAVQLELRKAAKDFQRQWAWFVGLATAGMVLTAALMGYGMVWWELRKLEELTAQRDSLTSEVNALQRQADQGRRGAAPRPAK